MNNCRWLTGIAMLLAGCGCMTHSRHSERAPLCRPALELEDRLDPRTGLAPLPRNTGQDDSRPSGPSYWRQMTPFALEGASPAADVVVLPESVRVTLLDGSVKCWRLPYNRFSYLPSGRDPEWLVQPLTHCDQESEPAGSPVPAIQSAFEALGEVTHIEAGRDLACALFRDGEVQCLGTALTPGRASASDHPSAPTLIPGLTARAISVNGNACAITLQHAVVCWGFIAQTAMFPACGPSK
jgi:hypothetical protein